MNNFDFILEDIILDKKVQITEDEYYGGEDEAPEISKSLNEMVEIDMGEEYVYLWFMGEWNCYSVGRKYDEHWNVIETNISPVIIPQEQIAS